MDELVKWLHSQLDTNAVEIADPYAAKAWHARDCEALPDILYPDREPGACDCGVPARVLREIDAARELLSRYEAMAADVLVMTGVESIHAEYRRVILPNLAQRYVDRPGFREEWRP